MRRLASVLVFVLLLAGCGDRSEEALVPTEATAPGTAEVDLLVATTRARNDGPTLFNGERADALDFAHVAVSVPPNHVPGAIEWPSRTPGDPAREFVTRTLGYVTDRAAFASRLRAALEALPPERRSVGVFVHGYNTNFAEGVFRASQIVHDTGFDGVPVLFTWASRGEVTDYVYDRDSATVARDALEETLTLAGESSAREILLFAHSMGNWVAIEALRQARISGNTGFEKKLGPVILAAPDIDVDVFKAAMRRYGEPKQPFIMFASSDDQALALSRFISGDKPRLGAYTEDAAEIADLGVIVVDLSAVEGEDPLNHAKFATVLPEFARRMRERLAAGDRLDVGQASFADATGALGGSLGAFLGSTAGFVVTLPARLVTAPLRAVRR